MSVTEREILPATAAVDAEGASLATLEAARVLTPQQLMAIPLLVIGRSVRDTACGVGVHEQSVTRWITQHDAFRAELARQKQLRYEQGLQRAYSVIDAQLDDPDKLVSWRAGNTRLQHHAQMARAHGTLTVTHTVLDKVSKLLQAMPDQDSEDGVEDAELVAEDGSEPEDGS